jgi:hypothetical protein
MHGRPRTHDEQSFHTAGVTQRQTQRYLAATGTASNIGPGNFQRI